MAINAESEFGVPPRKLHPIATLSPSTSSTAFFRARSRWRWRVVARIDVPRIVHFDLDNGYAVEIAFVPYGLPDDHALRGLYDDRLIAVPAMAGSVWMTLFTAEDQRCAGALPSRPMPWQCDAIRSRSAYRSGGEDWHPAFMIWLVHSLKHRSFRALCSLPTLSPSGARDWRKTQRWNLADPHPAHRSNLHVAGRHRCRVVQFRAHRRTRSTALCADLACGDPCSPRPRCNPPDDGSNRSVPKMDPWTYAEGGHPQRGRSRMNVDRPFSRR